MTKEPGSLAPVQGVAFKNGRLGSQMLPLLIHFFTNPSFSVTVRLNTGAPGLLSIGSA